MVKLFRKRIICAWLVSILLVWYIVALPDKLFNDPYSTVLVAEDSSLLSATLANDGQWRFPQATSLPDRYVKAIVAFEDKRFYNHIGVDFLATANALVQNMKAGKIVRGGSTVTMQVIRLSRKGKPRTLYEKFVEIILATRLEFRYSKEEIISLYASHAPFGGNVVGIEAACWRYFGRSIEDLSWAEAATLAVLPNAPALIHPGKNRILLKQKRDKLLDKLYRLNVIDSVTCILSKEETIPEKPTLLPRHARHLLARSISEGFAQQRVVSSIDFKLQTQVEELVDQHHLRLKGNLINNVAAVVFDVETGQALAYVGNVSHEHNVDGKEVDLITSSRSTGSILKPFLFAAMLDDGKISSRSLLPDIPTSINGFAPKNFSRQFDGAVHADQALIRSLNVPAVHMLQEYRYERFHQLLKNIGMTTLQQPADHYGLALILGGAEGTLWDITGMYASMARTLNHYFNYPGSNRYRVSDFHKPVYVTQEHQPSELQASSFFSAASIYLTFDALQEVYRPGEETGWRYFAQSKRIAWKTGTSFGFRDGWAVGITSRYAVGVWVGNANGEGRPGLTGTESASPLMFDIFALLPDAPWFFKPEPELAEISLCKQSGYRATSYCTDIDTVNVQLSALELSSCSYHQVIHLSTNKKFRVNTTCASVGEMVAANWFVLPPVQEYYFKTKNISYKTVPPWRSDCMSSTVPPMDLIYPKTGARVFIPRELDGSFGYAVFELAHRLPETAVYWHLNDQYLGSTRQVHQMPVQAAPGRYTLTIMDDSGNVLKRDFTVISGRN